VSAETTHAKDVDTAGLVERVRSLPEGERKRRLQGRLLELGQLLASPRCGDMQADGTPCGSPESTCETCGRARELVLSLVREIAE
jgi:hypothetical protein